MRGKVVLLAGTTGFGAFSPLFALLWLLSGCGAQTSGAPFADVSAVAQRQPTAARTPSGTAKKGPSTLPLASRPALAPTLTSAALTFPNTQAGSASAAQMLTAVAQDNHPVTADLVAPAPFTVTAGASCAASTFACTLATVFRPTGVGPATAAVRVTDMVNGLSVTASLTGTGSPVPQPVLSLSASILAFAATQMGSSATQRVTLTNTGSGPLTFSSFFVNGPQASNYAQQNTCAVALPPGSACTVSVAFTPSGTGSRVAALQIADDASVTPAVVSLSGSGVAAPAPVLSLPVSTIAFNSTLVGATTTAQPITLTNSGNAPLAITAFVLTGTDAADYTQANTCTASLPPAGTCNLSLSFTPAASGSRPATLQILSDASANPAALTLTGLGTAVGANTLIPGANAYLPFSETSGSIAHDSSGHGNDCSFGTGNNAPTWNNRGLQFNDGTDGTPRFCNLPASATNADSSVMNSRTLTMCAYFSPINVINNRSYAAVLGGSSRMNVGALFLSGDAHVRSAYYMGDYFGYGGVPTYSTQPLVGYHCVTYALGSATEGTLDHFYIDDTEVTSYGAQGTVWDRRAPGDFYQVGAIPWDAGSYLWGIVYALLAYPSQLAPASIAHNFAVLQQSSFYARGVGALSIQSTTTANVLITSGDSITNQTPGGVLPYPYLLSLNRPFALSDTAIAGKLLETEVADSPLVDLPLYSLNSPYAFISNAAGINDINVGGSTESQIIGYRATINAAYKQQGFTVLSPTLVSSLGADNEVQSINAALRTAAIANGYFLIDWANDPCLGAAGAYANLVGCAFFQADGLHPSQAGENEMARLYSNIVNYLTGSTAASPTLVTAASYTLAAADRFLTAHGAAAQSITLPTCYGWSVTTPFSLTNANSAGLVILTPSNGVTLNGGIAAVPIPAATTLQIYADILSPTTSGCGWHTR